VTPPLLPRVRPTVNRVLAEVKQAGNLNCSGRDPRSPPRRLSPTRVAQHRRRRGVRCVDVHGCATSRLVVHSSGVCERQDPQLSTGLPDPPQPSRPAAGVSTLGSRLSQRQPSQPAASVST
jgi:hypothetical protein